MKEKRITKTNHTPRSSRLLLLLGFMLAMSCTGNEIYNKHVTINNDGWNSYDSKTFTIEIGQDSIYDINTFVRHDNQYQYSNLWLFVDHTRPDSTTTNDTINIKLADHYGNWIGGGWGSTHQIQHSIAIKQELDSGTHTISITQAMRENQLQGIKNIGLNIQYHKQ